MLNVQQVCKADGADVFKADVGTCVESMANEIRGIAHKMQAVLNTFLAGATFAERVSGDGESMSALLKSKVKEFATMSIRLKEIANPPVAPSGQVSILP